MGLFLLSPTQADRGDAARFEAAVAQISQLAKRRPSVDKLLDSVRDSLPDLRQDAMTVSGLANKLSLSTDKDLPAEIIRIMLKSLDDKWARLYSPEESKNMRNGLDGDGTGILGLNLVAEEGRKQGILVSDVAPNGPSVGLIEPGERLQVIDGHDLRKPLDVSLDSLLHGAPGTVAHLQIADMSGVSRQVDVNRTDLDAPTVYVTRKDSVTTEIRITSFGAQTAQELRAILLDHPTGSLVLDMRCNGGGYVKAAVGCSSLFIPDGSLVVQTENPDGVTEHRSEGAPVYHGNVCLLVNSKTASAAEIFTSCLQYHLGAKVIGETTYGKGSVQRIVDLPGDWALKVTTSAYRTAAGALIDGIGIKPDIELKMPIAACRTDIDTQMAQARLHLRALAGLEEPRV
jgi:carboxyl-terminal processing protease